MPKIKTNRAARKRFRETGTGKIRRNRAFKRHNLANMTPKQKRNLRKSVIVKPADAPRVKRMLGG